MGRKKDEFKIRFNPQQVKDITSKLESLASGEYLYKAIRRCSKRAADAARTEAKRQLAREYTLPSNEILHTMRTYNLPDSIGATLKVSSSSNPLPLFKGTKPKKTMPPAKGPVKVKNKNSSGENTLANAFVANMPPGGHIGVYERDEENKLNQLFGPSVTGMLNANDEVQQAVIEKAWETFEERVEHELDQLLKGTFK